jgi:hypothetical protein
MGRRLAQMRFLRNPKGVQQEKMFFIRRRNLKFQLRQTLKATAKVIQIEPISKYIYQEIYRCRSGNGGKM